MTACPTVKIKPSHKSQGDFVEINESDFDPKVHELFEAPPVEPVVPPPPPPPPGPVDPLAGLPNDWRKREPAALRQLAEQVTGRTPENKAQAIQLIEQALAARQK